MRGERPVRRLNSRIQSTTRGGLGQRCAKLRGVEDEKRAALAALPWRHPTHSLRTPRTYRDGSWRSCPRDDFLDGLLVSASCWWDLPPIRMARKSRRRRTLSSSRLLRGREPHCWARCSRAVGHQRLISPKRRSRNRRYERWVI